MTARRARGRLAHLERLASQRPTTAGIPYRWPTLGDVPPFGVTIRWLLTRFPRIGRRLKTTRPRWTPPISRARTGSLCLQRMRPVAPPRPANGSRVSRPMEVSVGEQPRRGLGICQYARGMVTAQWPHDCCCVQPHSSHVLRFRAQGQCVEVCRHGLCFPRPVACGDCCSRRGSRRGRGWILGDVPAPTGCRPCRSS